MHWKTDSSVLIYDLQILQNVLSNHFCWLHPKDERGKTRQLKLKTKWENYGI